MKVYLIGIGMEGKKTLTREAAEAIAEADILIGADRMLAPFDMPEKQKFSSHKAEEIAEYLRICEKSCAAVLLSGDIGFYSGAKKLRSVLAEHELHVLSGISSPVYFADKIGISWEHMKFISLHGAESNIVIHVRQNRYCFFLLGGAVTAEFLCRKLCDYGMQHINVYIGERLGYPEERILSGTAKDFRDCPTEYLSVLITENKYDCQGLPFVTAESDFYDDSVKKHVPITKAEVRTLAVSSLEIHKQDICWDIGSGTGSVTVDMAQRCPDGKVYAVDKQISACTLTERNAHQFFCDNIHVFHGKASETLVRFPAPDKVFIGGSSGNLTEILKVIYQKNPSTQIAVTAVTLETLENAIHAFADYGTECSVTQIAITRTQKISSYTMLMAQNPVFLIRGALQ